MMSVIGWKQPSSHWYLDPVRTHFMAYIEMFLYCNMNQRSVVLLQLHGLLSSVFYPSFSLSSIPFLFYFPVIPLCSSPFIFLLNLHVPCESHLLHSSIPLHFVLTSLQHLPYLDLPKPLLPQIFPYCFLNFPSLKSSFHWIHSLLSSLKDLLPSYFLFHTLTVSVVLLYSFYSAKSFQLVLIFLDPNCPPGHVPLCGQESKAARLSARVWRLREAPSTRQFHV